MYVKKQWYETLSQSNFSDNRNYDVLLRTRLEPLSNVLLTNKKPIEMNAAQRKFVIEKIQQKTKARIEELKNSRLQYPSASNYLFKAIMGDALELQPKEVILEALKKKALQAKEGTNWLSDEHMGINKETTVKLRLKELLVLPQDFSDELERVQLHNDKIQEEIKALQMQLETIEVRVQLATDKTLQNLINEVDDMGELSLIDTKLKLLS